MINHLDQLLMKMKHLFKIIYVFKDKNYLQNYHKTRLVDFQVQNVKDGEKIIFKSFKIMFQNLN